MDTILLLIELFVTLALIGIVLIQRSEGGGLGIGGSQGMGSFMGGRGTANLLTRTTAILAAIFMVLAIAIGLLHRGGSTGSSILNVPATTTSAPASAPATPAPASTAPAAGTPAATAPTNAGPTAATKAEPAKTPAAGATPAPSAPAAPAVPTGPAVPIGPAVPTQ